MQEIAGKLLRTFRIARFLELVAARACPPPAPHALGTGPEFLASARVDLAGSAVRAKRTGPERNAAMTRTGVNTASLIACSRGGSSAAVGGAQDSRTSQVRSRARGE